MTAAGTLREFEQRFLSQRTIAANRESWEQYAGDMLPLTEAPDPKIQQGFEAGFDAAMNRVRVLLMNMQDDINREGR